MPALPPQIGLMAEHGNGRVSRRDLIALGYPARTIHDWADTGLLEADLRGELRIPGAERNEDHRLRGMVNRAGTGARIAGGLLLGLRGIAGFTHVEDDHIAVSPHRRVRGVDFVVVRTRLPPEDLDRVRDLPAVTVARGLIGAAATYHAARVRAGFDDAHRKGLVTEEELCARVDALGNVHGAPQMRRILRSGALRMESEKERELFDVLRPGDPKPVPQVWVTWHGRWFRLDFAYLEARLDLEHDGGNHDDRREDDAERDLALAELDIQTLRITKGMLRDPAETRRRILAVREARLGRGLPPIVPGTPPWLAS